METNTSGQGPEAEAPAEIQGWSWGAFLLNWVWGIGNNTYRAFLMFVPFVNIIMAIALGIKGNEWAWRNKKWDSVAHFKSVQKKWAKAGFVVAGLMLLLGVAMVFGIQGLLKDSEAYKMSLAKVTSTPSVISRTGSPVEAGFVTGGIQTSGPGGEANLLYTLEGPNGEATVAVEATKRLGSWSIECLVVNYPGTGESEALIPCQ